MQNLGFTAHMGQYQISVQCQNSSKSFNNIKININIKIFPPSISKSISKIFKTQNQYQNQYQYRQNVGIDLENQNFLGLKIWFLTSFDLCCLGPQNYYWADSMKPWDRTRNLLYITNELGDSIEGPWKVFSVMQWTLERPDFLAVHQSPISGFLGVCLRSSGEDLAQGGRFPYWYW